MHLEENEYTATCTSLGVSALLYSCLCADYDSISECKNIGLYI